MRLPLRSAMVTLGAFIPFVFFALPVAHAATYDLVGTGSWTTAGTWNPNISGGPTSTDDISITTTAAATLTLNSNSTQTFTVASLNFNQSNNVIILSQGSGTDGSSIRRTLATTGDFTKSGSGTLTIQNPAGGTSNYGIGGFNIGGNLDVNNGILAYGSSTGTNGVSGAMSVAGATTIGASGTLSIQPSTNTTLGATTLNGVLQFTRQSSGRTTTLSGLSGSGSIKVGTDSGSAVTQTLSFNQSAGSYTFSGTITEATNSTFAVTKSGGGLQVLSGNTTYTSATSITTISGGVLEFAGTSTMGAGLITLSSGGILGLGNGDLAISLAASGAGKLNMPNTGGGFAAYGADRTVTLNAGAALTWATGNFFGTSGNGVLYLGDTTSTHNVTLVNDISFAGAARTVSVGNGTGAVDGTLSGVLSSTSGALVKTGAGTLALTNANTYTGATTANDGTLLVSGTGSINTTSAINVTTSTAKLRYDSSVALSRNVTVTNGGTFAYNSSSNYTGTFTFTNGKLGGTNWNGVLGGLTIGANQTISPGNSVGAATSTTQTWAGLGSYDFEINKADGTAGLTAGGWDLLTLSGALTITATAGSQFNINVISLGLDNLAGDATGFVGTGNYHWLLVDSGSTITSFVGSAFAINTGNFSNANTGTWDLVLGNTDGIGGTDRQLYITYTGTIIPEPSAYAALLGAVGLGFSFYRRRRR